MSNAKPLPQFTSVGCYTILYVTKAGDALCAACATESHTLDIAGTYDEGPTLECDECGQMIESSYGECEQS